MSEKGAKYAGTADTRITATFRRSEWSMIGVALLGQADKLDGERKREYLILSRCVLGLLADGMEVEDG
jgi:hypothetical protein